MTPNDLSDVIEAGDVEALKEALTGGANPDAINDYRWSVLNVAVDALDEKGSLDSLILLLRASARANPGEENHAVSPLLMALLNGHQECARILLV